jgi:acetolactate synthase-like protein
MIGAFGTLGVGAGFALGAKLIRPESEVWIIYGDGSCGYSLAEIDTFTRHKAFIGSQLFINTRRS